jgi:hypothetical protein
LKNQIRIAIGALALLASTAVYAQTNFMHVKVPFDFVVSGQKMSAGEYTIEQSGSNGALLIRSSETRHSAIVLGEPGSSSPLANPGLTFERRNGEVYLVRVTELNGPARILAIR